MPSTFRCTVSMLSITTKSGIESLGSFMITYFSFYSEMGNIFRSPYSAKKNIKKHLLFILIKFVKWVSLLLFTKIYLLFRDQSRPRDFSVLTASSFAKFIQIGFSLYQLEYLDWLKTNGWICLQSPTGNPTKTSVFGSYKYELYLPDRCLTYLNVFFYS